MRCGANLSRRRKRYLAAHQTKRSAQSARLPRCETDARAGDLSRRARHGDEENLPHSRSGSQPDVRRFCARAAARVRGETSHVNPFPGLRPFEFDENYLFFGRDGQTDELLSRLRRFRFLALVGTSGSGKSSLVRAGLLPDIHAGMMTGAGSSWRVALFKPGNDPIGNLARALSSPEAFGSNDDANRAIIETTLRRSALGLIEVVRQE